MNRFIRCRGFGRLIVALIAFLLCGSSVLIGAARRAVKPPAVKSLRLYVFDCGLINGGDADLPAAYGLTTVASPPGMMSVACYLIVHPKGTLLWDLGLGDALLPVANGGQGKIGPTWTVNGKENVPYWSVDKTLKSQLAAIGYAPTDIDYIAMSHSHGDHTGNANDFAGSTWLVQRAERDIMFPPSGQSPRGSDVYNKLKYSKTILLDGDYDVFGDGSVIILSTPGHTPGHQSLFVKLTKHKPVVLSGDLYHYPEERTNHTTFEHDYNKEQSFASRDKIESFLKENGAELWIEHDVLQYRTLKLSPAYYE